MKNLSEKIEEATKKLELTDPDANAGLLDKFINRLVEAVGVSVLVMIVVVIFANADRCFFVSASGYDDQD